MALEAIARPFRRGLLIFSYILKSISGSGGILCPSHDDHRRSCESSINQLVPTCLLKSSTRLTLYLSQYSTLIQISLDHPSSHSTSRRRQTQIHSSPGVPARIRRSHCRCMSLPLLILVISWPSELRRGMLTPPRYIRTQAQPSRSWCR